MEAVAALIAVLGTCWVPGSPMSSSAAPPPTARNRPAAYCTYAGALHDYRRMLVHRWFAEHERPGEEDMPGLGEHRYSGWR
ncbi:hypothetical protein V1L54_02915 [Streptomyces sp. TRM 70361]|uniref:hypothetical protein n=1 Tax=Streptomyces sp. TRM 70361 TaxID=3116553 RepID=UPI002E7ABA9B|nr:hypothetical protein [Streptomyces sp. TRM 70361]MEE1938372.1 hypothetical protein [Streptomyces sp. TRM 70361]